MTKSRRGARVVEDDPNLSPAVWRRDSATGPSILSVCVPAYARPSMLARALRSVDRHSMSAPHVELLVSDNSPDITEAVVRPFLTAWPGPSRYFANRPNIGMIANFNQCLAYATGQSVLILHDDDFLLPGALERIVSTLRTPDSKGPVHLFGTAIVDRRGRVRRHLRQLPALYLPPPVALRRLLTNSSFARFPSVVVARYAYEAVGPFRDGFGGAEDLAMWIRLFSRYGVCLEAGIVSAYTIHPQAATEDMFNAETIGQLLALFDEARQIAIIGEEQLQRARRVYLEQFVLAGAYRQLVAGRTDDARRILALLDAPDVAQLGRSLHWAPVASLLHLVVRLPDAMWPLVGSLAAALEPYVPGAP
jgi:cellulose synthase/poly-beta-1,6-N-acetylglucosamine synthase-like glycosyltransferase